MSAITTTERDAAGDATRKALLYEMLKCFFILVRSKQGKQQLLIDAKDSLKRVILCLDPRSTDVATRIMVYDQFCLLCAVDPQYFPQIVEAVQYYKYVKREKVEYYDMICVLRDEPVEAIKPSCLRFINLLISSPEDVDERMKTRVAFLRLGLRGVIERVHGMIPHNVEFTTERNIFLEDEKEDQLFYASIVPDVIPDDALGTLHGATAARKGSRKAAREQQQVSSAPASRIIDPADKPYEEAIASLSAQLEMQQQDFLNIRTALQAEIERLRGEVQTLESRPPATTTVVTAAPAPAPVVDETLVLALRQQLLEVERREVDAQMRATQLAMQLDQERSERSRAVEEARLRGMEEASVLVEQERIERTRAVEEARRRGIEEGTLLAAATMAPPPPAPGPPPPPPPAPVFEMAAPPPPPPPPGAFGGPPPPPPPAGGGGLSLAAVAAGGFAWEAPVPKPNSAMKVVNWTKIPNLKLRGTYWESIKDNVGTTFIDFDEVEATFRSANQDTNDGPKPKGPKTVSLIAPKRSQAINIFLKSSRKTTDQIIAALYAMDGDVLTPEWTLLLQQSLPDSEEFDAVMGYHKTHPNSTVLGAPERFFIAIMKVPAVKPRVDAIASHLTLPPRVEEVRPRIETLRRAITQVKNSSRLRKVLEVVLTVGNFINAKNKARGNAAGIKISSLTQIADTKSVDNKSNLLQHITVILERVQPDALSMSSDLTDAEAASRISLQSIMDEASQVMRACDDMVKAAAQVPPAMNDQFHVYLSQQVIANHQFACKTLYDQAQICQMEFQDLAKGFGEDPKSATTEEFFQTFKEFSVQFDKSRAEVIEKRRKDELKRKKAGPALVPLTESYQAPQNVANAALAQVLSEQEKQAEIARRASEAIQADPMMNELMGALKKGNMAKERRTLRMKNREKLAAASVVVDPNAPPVALPINAMTKIFDSPKASRKSVGSNKK